MILYDDKMLLLLNVNVSNYIICNIHLRPRYYKHKSKYIWIHILIFVIVFFFTWMEFPFTWNQWIRWLRNRIFLKLPNDCLQCIMEIAEFIPLPRFLSNKQWRKTVLIFCMQIFVLTKQQTDLVWIDVCAGLNLFGWCPSPQW